MRSKLGVWLAVLLLAGVQLAAWAEAQPGRQWDTTTSTMVQAGPNTGEIETINKIGFHTNTGEAFPGSISVNEERILDANGLSVNPTDNRVNYSVSSLAWVAGPDSLPAPGGPGCDEHKQLVRQLAAGASPFVAQGSYGWEASLQARVAQAGTYRITFDVFFSSGQQHVVKTLQRRVFGWNRPYLFTVKDQYGRPIQGAHLSSELPVANDWGTCDSQGVLSVSLPPGTYRLVWYPPTGVDAAPIVIYPKTVTSPSSGDSVVMETITMTVGGNPPGSTAVVQGTVTDGDTGNPIAGVIVQPGSYPPTQTDANGKYTCTSQPPANGITVNFTKSGYTPGGVKCDFIAGVSKTLDVKMYTTSSGHGGPVGTETPGTGANGNSPQWWEYLFKPQAATLADWSTFLGQVANWGPWGFAKNWVGGFTGSFQAAPVGMTFEMHMQLFGEGSPAIGGVMDLRPLLPGTGTYPDGGRGTPYGTAFGLVRQAAGWSVYGLWVFALVRWALPRLQL